MVHSPESNKYGGAEKHPGDPALALRTQPMATTLVSVETREVVRCDYCSLVQYRTSNSLCRKCHKPLDVEEPAALTPQLVVSSPAPASAEAGLQVAGQVREIRKARHLSQRQLAGRMEVPRTYISKIENGKAIPTPGFAGTGCCRPRSGRVPTGARLPQPPRRRGSRHLCRSLPGRDCRLAAAVGLVASHAGLRRGCAMWLPVAAAPHSSGLVLRRWPPSGLDSARPLSCALKDCGVWALMLGSMVLHRGFGLGTRGIEDLLEP